MTDDSQNYNIAAIRKLLHAAFDDRTLPRFCRDRPVFSPIVDRFGPAAGLDDMVDQVVAYCDQFLLFDILLAEVKSYNPAQYARSAKSSESGDGERLPFVEVVTPTGQRMRGWLIQTLRDPVWQGVAALIAVVACAVAVGTWFWPDIYSALFPTPTAIASPTPSPTPPACEEQPAAFDFESQTQEGWELRWEGPDRLGESAMPDDGHFCGSGHWSLALSFRLTPAPPLDKAQVKYEAEHLSLAQELSAWIYVPQNAPADLQASCFVLEDNTAGTWPGKPEWPW
jgi:hypothetical protein